MGQKLIEANPQTDHTVAVFADHQDAEAAIKTLREAGFSLRNLSVIGQNYETEEYPVGFVNTGDRMLSWGKFGAFWGSIWGLLFGSAMFFVPGVGGIVLAGWVVAALEGALIGGGLAALGGALSSIGIPKDSVIEYEKAIKAGSFLLMVHGNGEDASKAKQFLSETHASRVDSYSTRLGAATSDKG
jgi:uncharacterized membrane protein